MKIFSQNGNDNLRRISGCKFDEVIGVRNNGKSLNVGGPKFM